MYKNKKLIGNKNAKKNELLLRKQISITIPRATERWLKVMMAETHSTRSQLIEQAVQFYATHMLDKEKAEKVGDINVLEEIRGSRNFYDSQEDYEDAIAPIEKRIKENPTPIY